MNYYLYFLNGPQQGHRLRLAEGTTVLGRGRDAQISVIDEEVSRMHAELQLNKGCLTVTDMSSSNGTFVNQTLVQHSRLDNGDQVQIGKSRFIVLVAPNADTYPPVESPELEPDHPEPKTFELALADLAAASAERGESTHRDLAFLFQSLRMLQESDLEKTLSQDLLRCGLDWLATDRAAILMRDQRQSLVPLGMQLRAGLSHRDLLGLPEGLVEHVVRYRKPVLTHDVASDDRWQSENQPEGEQVHEAICVPLQGNIRLYGVLLFDRVSAPDDTIMDRRDLGEHELALISVLAQQVAMAIENRDFQHDWSSESSLHSSENLPSGSSHQIKNMLQSINGGTHLIDRAIANNDQKLLKSGWQIVKENQQKLTEMLVNFLNGASAVDIPLRNRLTAMLQALFLQHQMAIDSLHVDLKGQVAPEVEDGAVDLTLLQSVISQLVTQALKAVGSDEPDDPRIRILLERRGDNLYARVSDNFQLPDCYEDVASPARSWLLAISRKMRHAAGSLKVKQNEQGLTFLAALPCRQNAEEPVRD